MEKERKMLRQTLGISFANEDGMVNMTSDAASTFDTVTGTAPCERQKAAASSVTLSLPTRGPSNLLHKIRELHFCLVMLDFCAVSTAWSYHLRSKSISKADMASKSRIL